MKCPSCASQHSRVVESRDVDNGSAVRRRRACEACHERFTTYERLERPRLLVVKKTGLREPYERTKLAHGIYKALEKRPIAADTIESAISDIEQAIFKKGEPEVRTKEIGELVMEHLAQIDDVAYVRFASVYRSFTSIDSFEKALNQIKRKRTS
ncbi:transcriptional repressor NrdR [Candidatus Saccharibacteria bacterium]|nr:transcriptional repressor NrdR [Candidatus Saccharibacteria bacterium]